MPITPLHFGVLAPVNHFFPGKVSLVSFTLINLWMDGNAILYFGFGLETPSLHGPDTHSLLAAVVMATVLSMFRCTSDKCIYGAFYGGFTHILLDSLVHSEMQPIYPIHWNPMYLDGMGTVSLLLVPLLIWFIVQIVSSVHDSARKLLKAP